MHVNAGPTHISVSERLSQIAVGIAEANPWPLEENVWWICRVKVPASHHRKGLGSKLLQRLLEEIKATGAKAVIVAPGGYTLAFEDQARFYQKNGFKQVSPDGLHRIEWAG